MMTSPARCVRRDSALVIAAAILISVTGARATAQFVPGSGYGRTFTSGGVYGPGYGYGAVGGYGVPAGYGYGGLGSPYGSYGGVGLGYGGYGYGGLGITVGMTAADQAMMRYQQHARSAARYNMTNAQTALSYQAALLYRQEALQTMLENRQTLAGQTPEPRNYAAAPGEGQGQPDLLSLNQLVASNGQVQWPLGAPTEGDFGPKRQEADQAIQSVLAQFAAGERVPVRDIIAARDALADYAVPAAERFDEQGQPEDYDDFVRFVQSLDAGLRNIDRASAAIADRPVPGRPADAPPMPVDIKPEDAPRTGGDALKEAIDNDPGSPGQAQGAGEPNQPVPPPTPEPPGQR